MRRAGSNLGKRGIGVSPGAQAGERKDLSAFVAMS